MSTIELKKVCKIYDKDVLAVKDFSIKIEEGEFIVFVGPSGCGKSTTLRMIAGLEEISSGELYIDGKYMNDVEPKDRDLAMVFQNYALYPYLTVRDNIAFGLKLRKVPKAIIKQKVEAAAKMLEIEEYLNRKPSALSGGQRQRVALGRAIVRDANAYLLDEPLSNLDAKLRASMRVEIINLFQTVKKTFIYVTHDQVEAMTMGTRIVVMNRGIVQQIDTPAEIYDHPVNKFVAGFIGTPQMNFFESLARVKGNVIDVDLGCGVMTSLNKNYIKDNYFDGNEKKAVILGVRSEDIVLSNKGIAAEVELIEMLGSETLIHAHFNGHPNHKFVIKSPERVNLIPGDKIFAELKKDKIHVFDHDSEWSIKKED